MLLCSVGEPPRCIEYKRLGPPGVFEATIIVVVGDLDSPSHRIRSAVPLLTPSTGAQNSLGFPDSTYVS